MYDTINSAELQDAARKTAANHKVVNWLGDLMPLSAQAAMQHCGDYLVFLENAERDKRKLDTGYFCKQRLCSGCAWRSALKSAQCISAISAALAADRKIMLMVTLTVPNCPAVALRDTMRRINAAWHKMLRRKKYACWADYIRKMEITYNHQANTYHPHLHCIVYVEPGYFARSYIPQAQLLADWRAAYGDNSITQVDLRRCKQVREGTSAILEVSKYAAKASDFAVSEEVARVFYRALHHARMMEYAGRCADLRDKYQAGGLAEYEEIDTVRYTLRVVYVYSRLAQAYDVQDIQPYNMDEAELARLQADEARLGAYACAQANSAEGWREWLRTDWVRAMEQAAPWEIEVLP